VVIRSIFRSLTVAALFLVSAALFAVPGIGATQPDPFSVPARVRVLLFVRTDCPITNRYAPELRRIAEEFRGRDVRFWLVYPDRSETDAAIREHIRQYQFPGDPIRDPEHELVRHAHATVAPEAAVFGAAGNLVYHGRIDDRYVDIGKARPAAQTHDLEDAIRAVLAGKQVAQAETRAVGCSLRDVE
jgi:AhpC/TSA family